MQNWPLSIYKSSKSAETLEMLKPKRRDSKPKARLEASLKAHLVEAVDQVSRARETLDQARVAAETTETTALASRQGTQSGSNHFYLRFEPCHIPPSRSGKSFFTESIVLVLGSQTVYRRRKQTLLSKLVLLFGS